MADTFNELKSLTKIRPHSQATENNHFALFVLVTGGVAILNTLLLVINAFSINNVANRPLPTMVQTINGKTIQVTAFESKNRSPQLIKDFTAMTLSKLFTWSRYLPAATTEEMRRPKIDPGASIESKSAKGLIPTTVWAGSFALSDKFREEFLGETIAPLLTKLGVLQGQSEVTISILDLGDPIEVKGNSDERLWKVNVVANLILRSAANVSEKTIPFNKTIYVKAIYPATLPQAATPGDLAQVVAIAQSSGLQIYAVERYQADDLKPPAVTAPPVSTNVKPTTPQK
ncbi:hypothetical protein [Chamaesiphon sp.]|uniref:hypothetical protein n=1 Tax=Chamaesiphon sp. TaxID=2814140 RepID=UPI003592F355